MEIIIKFIFAIGIPLLCIWASGGCFELMEEK